MNRTRLLTLIEIAILSAMAFVLGKLEFSFHPQGGGISLVMVPLVILALRRGVAAGLIGGLLVGLMKLIGGYILFPMQAILDYPLPFMLIGFAGMFVGKNKAKSFSFYTLGIILAGLLKGFCHVLSGVIFFAEYVWDGWNVWPYSIAYNATYVVPETILAIVAAALIYFKANHLFQPNSR